MAQAIMRRRKANANNAVEVGAEWTLTAASGTFKVPVSGNYQVEIHGGGGGGTRGTTLIIGGGGSGEVYTVELTRGDNISYTVGKGGSGNGTTSSVGADGKKSTFGSLSVNGGGGGRANSSSGSVVVNNAIGSLATSGKYVSGEGTAQGGYGNKDRVSQTYGNGGSASEFSGKDGSGGGIIVTYLGKE